MSLELHTSRQSKILTTVIDALILLGIGAFILLLLQQCEGILLNPTTDSDTTVIERTVILPPDTVYLDVVKAKIVYRNIFVHDSLVDTVIETKPFTASMDTTLGCNSISLEYRFPENTFNNLNFVSCPDTILIQDTIIQNTTVTSSFWDDVRNIGIGFVGGFVLGSVIK